MITLTFAGAARNVTGSCFLVKTDRARVLVDCGIFQERKFRERNWNDFPFEPSRVDCVLLTHAHLDHCGLLPKLVKEGFSGPVHCTGATARIASIVLADSARLQREDVEYKKKRHRKAGRRSPHPYEPLYTEEDVERCAGLFSSVEYGEPLEVAPGIRAEFSDAGHIFGSSSLRLLVEDGDGNRRSIVFSGDVGRWNKPIIRDPEPFESADVVVIESTYGDRRHEDHGEVREALAAVVNDTFRAGGNLVIPSFAIERTHELLYHLNILLMEERIPPLMVFVDSPMAFRVTEVFKRFPAFYDDQMRRLVEEHHSPFSFSSLKFTASVEESKAINHIKGTSIIVAGSGMCTGGRIKHHLVHNIGRRESTILFVGYQAVGTLGREILDGAKKVRIHGEKHHVRASIRRIEGFSGHADSEELLRWFSTLRNRPSRVFVVHGEESSAEALARLIEERSGAETYVPSYMEEYRLCK